MIGNGHFFHSPRTEVSVKNRIHFFPGHKKLFAKIAKTYVENLYPMFVVFNFVRIFVMQMDCTNFNN